MSHSYTTFNKLQDSVISFLLTQHIFFLKSHSFKVMSPPCASSLPCAQTKSEGSKNISLAISRLAVQDKMRYLKISIQFPSVFISDFVRVLLVYEYICETCFPCACFNKCILFKSDIKIPPPKKKKKMFYLIYETVCSHAGVAKRLFKLLLHDSCCIVKKGILCCCIWLRNCGLD